MKRIMEFVSIYRPAFACMILAAIGVVGFGWWYAAVAGIAVWRGLFLSSAIGSTSGYAQEPVTSGTEHIIVFLMFICVIPLETASITLFLARLSSNITKRHTDRAVAHLAEISNRTHRITADLYKHHTGKEHPAAAAPGDGT